MQWCLAVALTAWLTLLGKIRINLINDYLSTQTSNFTQFKEENP
jgi:hypothetical protein